jgi:hypothetical protein
MAMSNLNQKTSLSRLIREAIDNGSLKDARKLLSIMVSSSYPRAVIEHSEYLIRRKEIGKNSVDSETRRTIPYLLSVNRIKPLSLEQFSSIDGLLAAPMILCEMSVYEYLRDILKGISIRILVMHGDDGEFLDPLTEQCLSLCEIRHDIICIVYSDNSRDTQDFFSDKDLSISAIYIRREDPNSIVSLMRLIISSLSSQNADLLVRSSGLMKSISQLRLTHDNTQSAFRTLENRYLQFAAYDLQTVVNLQPVDCTEPFQLGINDELYQILPTSSEGIVEIRLSIANSNCSNGSTIEISLSLLESSCLIAEWVVKPNENIAGWIRLGLYESISIRNETPVIKIKHSGDGFTIVEKSLYCPDPDFRPKLNETSFDNAVSLIVIKTAPGVKQLLPEDYYVDIVNPIFKKNN